MPKSVTKYGRKNHKALCRPQKNASDFLQPCTLICTFKKSIANILLYNQNMNSNFAILEYRYVQAYP